MHIDLRWTVLALCGCVFSSTRDDVEFVRQQVRLDDFPNDADSDVDVDTKESVRELLRSVVDGDKAARIAVANNRELAATLRELGIARGKLMTGAALPNPRLEAEFLPERNSNYELRAEFDITATILTPVKARAASSELWAEKYRAAAAAVTVSYSARAAFAKLQAAEQKRTLALQFLDAFSASHDAAVAIRGAGNISERDAALQEVSFEKAKIFVAELELAAADERESVVRLFGVSGKDTEWKVAPLPSAPERAEIPQNGETKALAASLRLREVRYRLEGLARQTGSARMKGWLPDISADIHALLGDPEVGDSNQRDWRFGAGISMSLPIFDRGQGVVTAYESQFDALLERYYGTVNDVQSMMRDAQNRVVSTHRRALQYQNVILPAQAKVVKQTLLHYNAMQLGVFDLLQTSRDELELHMAYADTLAQYWISVARLHALLAGGMVEEQGGGVAAPTKSASEPLSGDH